MSSQPHPQYDSSDDTDGDEGDKPELSDSSSEWELPSPKRGQTNKQADCPAKPEG